MQHIFARHNAHAAAGVQPAAVKIIALCGQRSGAHGRDIAKHTEEGEVQRIAKGDIRLAAPQQHKADRRFHRLVGKAHHEQRKRPRRRYSAKIGKDLRQRIAEDQQKRAEEQRQRHRAEKIHPLSLFPHFRFPPSPDRMFLF